MKTRHLEYVVGSAISATAFVLYALTACRTVTFIDSGELATVACTLGIAHPTGYPLFTLLGWLAVHLPLGLRPIFQLNLMAASLCAAALFMFFRFFLFALRSFLPGMPPGSSGDGARISSRPLLQTIVPATFATLMLGFSETYWSQGLAIEVYSLHLLLVACVLFLFSRAAQAELDGMEVGGGRSVRGVRWTAFAFALGLAFTNHMTTILLAPAFLYLYFVVAGFRRPAWIGILRMVPPFLLGFSLYLYLPARASMHPLMNWGNPVDLERFLWHFSGKVYRVWIFSSFESASKQLNFFVSTLPEEFAWFPLVFAVLGLVDLLAHRRRLFVFTVLLFLGCLLYSINYDIHDISSYFLLAYITIALWAGAGCAWMLRRLAGTRHIRIAAAVLVASCAIPAAVHYGAVDESDDSLVEEYTKDVFRSVDRDAIIISYQWDYFVSATNYFQFVEHLRPDIVVIDKELLRRSWYYRQLGDRYPWLVAASKKEIEAFLVELDKFEHDRPYNSSEIEYRYRAVIQSFIRNNLRTHPVYVTNEMQGEYTGGFARIPTGLAFRLYADTLRHEIARADFSFRVPRERDTYIDGILTMYAYGYLNNALYLAEGGQTRLAREYAEHALKIEPDFAQARALVERLDIKK